MAYCVAGAYTIQNCLAVGTENLYGDIILCGTNRSYGEGIVANPSPSGYMALFFRTEACQGSNYSCTWAIGKNAGSETGGELLQVVKEGLTGGALYRADALQQWKTNGDSIFGFNVGIGTTSPDTRLHIRNCVNGSTNNFLLTLQNTCTVADARAGIAFLDNSNTAGSGGVSGASIQVANNGIDGTGHLLFSSLLNGAVTERMRITSGGCVGIGTTSPNRKLTISRATESTSPQLEFRNEGGISDGNFDGISFTQGAAGDVPLGSIRLKNATNGYPGFGIYTRSSDAAESEKVTITNGGYVGIGTSSPNSKFHVASGQIRIEGQPSDDITGCSGYYLANAPNNEAFQWQMSCNFNLSLWTYSATNGLNWGLRGPVITQTGRVGIGTTSPGYKLNVVETQAGCATIGIQNTSTTGYSGAHIFNNSGTLVGHFGYANSSIVGGLCDLVYFGSIASKAVVFTTNDTEKVRITTGGNVGIGTTSPNAILHVQGSSADGTATFRVTSTSAPSSFNYAGSLINGCLCSNRNYILLIGQDLSNRNSGYIGYNHTGTSNSNNNFLTFGHYQSDNLLNLLGNGNLGVGTTSPGSKLTVAGTVTATDTIKTTSGTVNTVLSWTSTTGVVGTETNHALQFRTNDTEKLRITTVGDLGLGTTTPQNYTGYVSLTIGDNDVNKKGLIKFKSDFNSGAGAEIYQSSAGVLSFSMTGASIAMGINCSNDVGIGTISPSYRLHVNGTFYAAGSSIKYKEGICNYDTNSCLFMCLKPVTYQYKDEFKHLGKELKSDIQIGLIAEDVAEVMPELAVLVNEEDEKVVRNVDYEKLSIVLLAEVQKLRKEVDELKK